MPEPHVDAEANKIGWKKEWKSTLLHIKDALIIRGVCHDQQLSRKPISYASARAPSSSHKNAYQLENSSVYSIFYRRFRNKKKSHRIAPENMTKVLIKPMILLWFPFGISYFVSLLFSLLKGMAALSSHSIQIGMTWMLGRNKRNKKTYKW